MRGLILFAGLRQGKKTSVRFSEKAYSVKAIYLTVFWNWYHELPSVEDSDSKLGLIEAK